MDGIITIVVIAIAIIFKVIDKRLKKAAGEEPFPTITIEPGMMKEDPAEFEQEPVMVHQLFEEAQKALPSEPVETVAPVAPVEQQETQKSAEVAAPVRKKGKIDLKKMIVYSEIMKPKYLE